MKGLFTPVTQIRRQISAELARIAWEGRDPMEVDDIPYNVVDRKVAQYRGSVFHERAIVEAKTLLALGLDREPYEDQRLSKRVEEAIGHENVMEWPIINVIPFACEGCPDSKHFVTNNCRKCIAHPCMVTCPVNAISMGEHGAVIDTEKCVDCGKCKQVCPYSAIIKRERPCKEACGADAITSDEYGKAQINYDKCVSCGMCMNACPFAAITDKSCVYQLVSALREGEKVHAIIAPAFVGQFGPLASPGKIVSALKKLGFCEVVEAAYGADVVAKHECELFNKVVPAEKEFLGTSCCPAWTMTVDKFFPELKDYVAESNTPMVETAKVIRERSPEGKIVFIGPCVAKKVEGIDEKVKPYIDFVITFEELAAIFVAADIDVAEIEEDPLVADGSGPGRNFAFASGVAQAVKESAAVLDPENEVEIYSASGVADCRKMLAMAKAGKLDGKLIEGMGCPDGCIGGAGTLLPVNRAKKAVQKFAKESPYQVVFENPLLKEEEE